VRSYPKADERPSHVSDAVDQLFAEMEEVTGEAEVYPMRGARAGREADAEDLATTMSDVRWPRAPAQGTDGPAASSSSATSTTTASNASSDKGPLSRAHLGSFMKREAEVDRKVLTEMSTLGGARDSPRLPFSGALFPSAHASGSVGRCAANTGSGAEAEAKVPAFISFGALGAMHLGPAVTWDGPEGSLGEGPLRAVHGSNPAAPLGEEAPDFSGQPARCLAEPLPQSDGPVSRNRPPEGPVGGSLSTGFVLVGDRELEEGSFTVEVVRENRGTHDFVLVPEEGWAAKPKD
jgi:hypothetical protein